MKKEEYIKRYGEEAYEDYKKKQKLLTKKWREKNSEKARKYGREYYARMKMLAMMAMATMTADDKDKNI
jgi:hypothetical protein